jgi:hypothetical protein
MAAVAIFGALLHGQGLAASTRPLPPVTFVCAENIALSSQQKLEDIAIAEVEQLEPNLKSRRFTMNVSRMDCDWWVVIRLIPNRPGGHFGVLIDNASGRAKWSAKIDERQNNPMGTLFGP